MLSFYYSTPIQMIVMYVRRYDLKCKIEEYEDG